MTLSRWMMTTQSAKHSLPSYLIQISMAHPSFGRNVLGKKVESTRLTLFFLACKEAAMCSSHDARGKKASPAQWRSKRSSQARSSIFLVFSIPHLLPGNVFFFFFFFLRCCAVGYFASLLQSAFPVCLCLLRKFSLFPIMCCGSFPALCRLSHSILHFRSCLLMCRRSFPVFRHCSCSICIIALSNPERRNWWSHKVSTFFPSSFYYRISRKKIKTVS